MPPIVRYMGLMNGLKLVEDQAEQLHVHMGTGIMAVMLLFIGTAGLVESGLVLITHYAETVSQYVNVYCIHFISLFLMYSETVCQYTWTASFSGL